MVRGLVLLTLLWSTVGGAHPVSFTGGYGIMSYNDADMNDLMLSYSYSSKLAFATTYFREDRTEFYIPRVNLLLNRWHQPDSQGNIYLSAGSGVEKTDTVKGAHLVEAVADWESRKYYTYLEHRLIHRPDSTDWSHTKLRLGFAPFLADYTDLNVWLITQFDRHNQDSQIEATQFLRFYIRNVLWEIGAGFDGSMAFNFMIHM